MSSDPLYRELPDSFDERCSCRPPAKEPKSSWGPAVVVFVYFVAFSWTLSVAVPLVPTFFDQVGIDISSSTQSVVATYFFFRAHLWLWCLIGLSACLLAAHPFVRRSRHAGWLVILPFIFVTVWVVWGFFEPLMDITWGLSSRR